MISQIAAKKKKRSIYHYVSRHPLSLQRTTKEVEVVFVDYPFKFYCQLIYNINCYQKLMAELTAFAGDELLLSLSRFYFNILLSFQIIVMRKIIGYKGMRLALLNPALVASVIAGKSWVTPEARNLTFSLWISRKQRVSILMVRAMVKQFVHLPPQFYTMIYRQVKSNQKIWKSKRFMCRSVPLIASQYPTRNPSRHSSPARHSTHPSLLRTMLNKRPALSIH